MKKKIIIIKIVKVLLTNPPPAPLKPVPLKPPPKFPYGYGQK